MRSVISIDLGATNLRVGIVNEDLTIGKVYREPTQGGDPLVLYAQIKKNLEKILADAPKDIKYVGVSACGFVKDDIIDILPNLDIHTFDLKHHIEKDFPNLQVSIANDANAAGYMEATHGAATETRTSFFITISSGIGGVLIYNRTLIDLPFEIGHNFLKYKNKFYEAERLLSGNGLINLAKLNGLEISSAQELFTLVRQGDIKADKVYDDWIQNISVMLANVQLNYNPDVIVLSGGVMKSASLFEDDLIKVSNAFIAPFPVKKIRVVQAKFDQDAGLMGGAGLALRYLEEKSK